MEESARHRQNEWSKTVNNKKNYSNIVMRIIKTARRRGVDMKFPYKNWFISFVLTWTIFCWESIWYLVGQKSSHFGDGENERKKRKRNSNQHSLVAFSSPTSNVKDKFHRFPSELDAKHLKKYLCFVYLNVSKEI